VFSEKEFSGSQKKDDEEPIVIRGKYELTGKNAIRFIAEDFANEVVVLDGVFTYSLQEKTLTLTKQDGSVSNLFSLGYLNGNCFANHIECVINTYKSDAVHLPDQLFFCPRF
jgi:outer membrane lipoprotein-sorting protein